MSDSLHRFVRTAEAIRASSGKLEKTRLLTEFLRSLPDEELYPAVHYFTGAAFARSSGRVLQVGYAQIQSAVLAVTGAPLDAFGEQYLRWSDVGDAVAALF